MTDESRRDFLAAGFRGFAAFLGAPLLCGSVSAATSRSRIEQLGPLLPPDANGVMLPAGFTSRIVATTGQLPTPQSAAPWHGWPDGGAVFNVPDGGWVYVSNAELNGGAGGVGALLFDNHANLITSYPILTGTSRNCAGGATPWGTWLSCEETTNGRVYECDPLGLAAPVAWPFMGVFRHEAVAVDPVRKQLYLTEDEPDGRLYRFTPDYYPDLSLGVLEVAAVVGKGGPVAWHPVPDPQGGGANPTRYQVAGSTPFNGGEGIGYHAGSVYFTTKGDNRVWKYDTAHGGIEVIYAGWSGILTGVDNVVITPGGDVLVAEDGGDMQIVAITPAGSLVPVVQVVGHNGSEIAGPAFSPDMRRLYFSSQRGINGAGIGITFEVTGPFTGPCDGANR